MGNKKSEAEIIYDSMDQSERDALQEIEKLKDQFEDPRKANKIKNLKAQYGKIDEYYRAKKCENI